MSKRIRKLYSTMPKLLHEKGQGIVEFAILCAFCAVIGIASRSEMIQSIRDSFNYAAKNYFMDEVSTVSRSEWNAYTRFEELYQKHKDDTDENRWNKGATYVVRNAIQAELEKNMTYDNLEHDLLYSAVKNGMLYNIVKARQAGVNLFFQDYTYYDAEKQDNTTLTGLWYSKGLKKDNGWLMDADELKIKAAVDKYVEKYNIDRSNPPWNKMFNNESTKITNDPDCKVYFEDFAESEYWLIKEIVKNPTLGTVTTPIEGKTDEDIFTNVYRAYWTVKRNLLQKQNNGSWLLES